MTFDQFIYEDFMANYGGYKDSAIEAYEDYRDQLDDDDYMRLGDKFANTIRAELSATK